MIVRSGATPDATHGSAADPLQSPQREEPSGQTGTFDSILFRPGDVLSPPISDGLTDLHRDLHIDRIVDAVTAGFAAYDLAPFFRASLRDLDAVMYRHEVMRDLEAAPLMRAVEHFAERMRAMRAHLERSKTLYYKYEKQRWFLEAADTYCDAVFCLEHDLQRLQPSSRGMRALRSYLADYVGCPAFLLLDDEAKRLKASLSEIQYCVHIDGCVVTVCEYRGEPDYSAEVESTFERFRRGAVKDYRVHFSDGGGLNHIEAQVLDGVAFLYPEVFRALSAFASAHGAYLDEGIGRFDREVHFYIAYLAYVDRFRRAGLSFCYPQISDASKEVSVRGGFDAALAENLLAQQAAVVGNDLCLQGAERVVVVTGPNQGGKTTFARMLGQLHHLGSIGCLVPGTEARLFLFDRLFSHFQREENIETLRGKLRDELVRVHRILEDATSRSIVVINEIFSSTTLDDAVFLSKEILSRLSKLDALCVWVTFLGELASFDEKTVSVVARVDPADPTVRSYKLERGPASDRAFALAIAEKNRVTYRALMDRIPS